MVLVDFVEIGLPAWRVRARCDVLEPKPISPFDEIVMKAISLNVTDPIDLQILLGLDEVTLETTARGLVAREWAHDADAHGNLALSPAGEDVLGAAREIVAREMVFEFDYDGLLRRPVLDQRLLARRLAAESGIREIPPVPERPPDVAEVRGCRQAIAQIIKDGGNRRQKSVQLLTVSGFDRRERYVLPAVALIFAPEGRGRCEVGIAIDGTLSLEHETAFANAGLTDRIGLSRALRSTPRRALPALSLVSPRAVPDVRAEREAREVLREAQDQRCDGDGGVKTEEVRRAQAALSGLTVRTVLPHEHEPLIRVALEHSKRRLLVAGGAVSDAHVDGAFLQRMRQKLDRGLLVRFVVTGPAAGNERAFEGLLALERDYSNATLKIEDVGGDGVLLSDDAFAACGAFPWLGHIGDRTRNLTDVRSILVRDGDVVNELWSRLDGRHVESSPRDAAPDHANGARRRGRRRRRTEGYGGA